MKDTARQIDALTDELHAASKHGLELHKYHGLYALRLAEFKMALIRTLEKDTLDTTARVYYSENPNVIEVLARIEPERLSLSSIGILVTMNAKDFSRR